MIGCLLSLLCVAAFCFAWTIPALPPLTTIGLFCLVAIVAVLLDGVILVDEEE